MLFDRKLYLAGDFQRMPLRQYGWPRKDEPLHSSKSPEQSMSVCLKMKCV